MKGHPFLIFIISCCINITSCKTKTDVQPVFQVLGGAKTGLNFKNKLEVRPDFNVFTYMYFYNGAGVGAGDFNNDGLVDVFFASNQGDNSLFLNQGELRFKNVTAETNIPQDNAWSTGVSVVDINNDGLLDIYVSRVGKYQILNSHNQLLVCQGINQNGVPQYADKAKEYGLDYSGFGTQAAFLDYDADGDLDLFLLNHSIHENNNFRPRRLFTEVQTTHSGSRFYRNDSGHFTDVTETSGIYSNAIGYGLGVAVSDINFDGYPDVYIGNDFHENDYLYINQKNGQFKEVLESSIMHTSRYTMGVDIGDANNDGLPDIISVDMLPYDPYILRRSPGEDSYDVFNLKIKYGYSYQYSKNALQYNRGNGNFSEIAWYSGVSATDWSWAPLLVDFDNDGLKDLFISNGIPKRLNDIDYLNYLSDQSIQQKIIENKADETSIQLIDKFPQIKVPNRFYRNAGNMQFEDWENTVADNVSTYSNGAVYADLDNDGDLDVIVNNIDENAIVYQNLSNDKGDKKFLDIKLKGPENNINAIGSKVFVYAGNQVRTYEKFPVRGFLSSMEIPLHIGLDNSKPDLILLVWPDNGFEKITLDPDQHYLELSYRKGLPKIDYNSFGFQKEAPAYATRNITDDLQVNYKHVENSFPEFDREPLIPHMVSTEGPALAVGDINRDGLEDVFIGAARGEIPGLFIQNAEGKFTSLKMPSLEADSNYEDVDACWEDVNNDGNIDLVIASGGNEYYGNDDYLLPRVYLNDGKGNLTRKPDAISGIYETFSCVAPNDFNSDGYIDLFIGGRAVPGRYGAKPASYLLQNDGTGKFTDVTGQYSSDMMNAGFVTKAIWSDVNNDNKKDLVVCSEWGTIDAYVSDNGKFTKKVICDKKGWWNFVLPVDINNDGKIDFVAGNAGWNNKFKPSMKEPAKLYYGDFDENGKKEQILTYYMNGVEIPFASKAEMERQIPALRKRYLYAEDFAKASLEDLFTSKTLDRADVLTADYFSNSVLINKGDFNFEVQALPWAAQLTAYRTAAVINANNDSWPDILLAGNYYENNIAMGRNDADFGTILLNKGDGSFTCRGMNGSDIKGQVRHIKKLTVAKGRESFVMARNNDSAVIIQFESLPVKH